MGSVPNLSITQMAPFFKPGFFVARYYRRLVIRVWRTQITFRY